MQKERAQSALQRGLPVPTPLPTRARAPHSRSARPPAAAVPRTPVPAVPSRRLPLGVKLLGLALGLLGLVYGLTVFRDHLSAVEASLAAAAPKTAGSAAAPPNLGASLNAASLSPEPARSSSVK